MIYELFPSLTKTALGCHPCSVVSDFSQVDSYPDTPILIYWSIAPMSLPRTGCGTRLRGASAYLSNHSILLCV
jgi:hypothetical protein